MTQSDQTALDSPHQPIQGVVEPRIWTPAKDLPSKGQEMIDFVESLINPDTMENFVLTPWQKFLAIEMHRYLPDGRWRFPEVGVIISRQNGKSTFLLLRILTGMFIWGEKLQVHTAHKLTTSSEIFWKIDDIIQVNPNLAEKFVKKYETKGSQEIRTLEGRYLVRANNSAARGIAAPASIHMDEVREYHDEDVWESLRYTQMASKNPMAIIYSNAGDQHSLVLNKLRERGIAAAAGADDRIGWFEWSAEPGCPITINGEPNWGQFAKANPSLGYTIHPENIKAVLHDDESTIRTEVLCQWVAQINPAIKIGRAHV